MPCADGRSHMVGLSTELGEAVPGPTVLIALTRATIALPKANLKGSAVRESIETRHSSAWDLEPVQLQMSGEYHVPSDPSISTL